MRNLLYFLIGVLLSAVCVLSYADATTYSFFIAGVDGNFSTPSAACQAANSGDKTTVYDSVMYFSSSYYICKVKSVSSGVVSQSQLVQHQGICALPNVLDPATALCGAPPNPCVAGKSSTFSYMVSNTGRVPKFDNNDCPITPNAGRDNCFFSGTVQFCNVTGIQTGAAPAPPPTTDPVPAAAMTPPDGAVPSAPPVAADPSAGCPKGTLNIGIDSSGITMCAGKGTSPVVPTNTTVTSPETTTTNADGSNTSVNKQDITNTDGSITTYTNTCNKTAAGVTTCATTQSTGVASNGSSGVADGKPAAAPGTGTGNGANPSGAPSAASTPADPSPADHPVDTGNLYAKKGATVSGAFADFTNAISNAPFVNAANAFLGGNISVNGSCPSWVVSVAFLHMSLDLGQYFCGSTASSALRVLGIGVLIGAAYVAFGMAFL